MFPNTSMQFLMVKDPSSRDSAYVRSLVQAYDCHTLTTQMQLAYWGVIMAKLPTAFEIDAQYMTQ